jgi:hypothetical protein
MRALYSARKGYSTAAANFPPLGLKRRFALDDDYLEDLKEELIRNTQAPIDSYNLTGNPAQLAALRFRRTGLRRRNRSLGGRKAGRDCGWLLLSSPD